MNIKTPCHDEPLWVVHSGYYDEVSIMCRAEGCYNEWDEKGVLL